MITPEELEKTRRERQKQRFLQLVAEEKIKPGQDNVQKIIEVCKREGLLLEGMLNPKEVGIVLDWVREEKNEIEANERLRLFLKKIKSESASKFKERVKKLEKRAKRIRGR